MLKLHEYNKSNFDGGCIAVLDKAADVAVTEDIQQMHTVSFNYPCIDEKAKEITSNRVVSVNGQGYRLTSVTKEISDNKAVLHCEGTRLFFIDAERKHLPNVPNMPGVDPYRVLQKGYASITTTDDKSYKDYMGVFNDTKFKLLTDAELAALSMERIGADGTPIDFFSMDKTNPYAVCEAVIEAYGHGEIYVDNYNIAIVTRVGKDYGVRLSLDKNLQNLSIQKQTTELCTRLYPYGENDLTIATVNNGIPYIDSEEAIAKFGIVCGYKDYSEYTDPAKLKKHAEWDLKGEGNYYRLDTPQITITGEVIDLVKHPDYGNMEQISLGDTVHVYDEDGGEIEGEQRIINITYFPYESKPPRITIGAPSNQNLFYSQWQQGKLMKTLKKNSTTATSKIRAQAVSGSSARVTKLTADSAKTNSIETNSASATNITAQAADIGALSLAGTDVAAKLTDLQNQIDELRGEDNNA